MAEENKIADALQVLGGLGMPRAQQNDRSALCLLALLNLTREKSWAAAENPLVGITPMMEFLMQDVFVTRPSWFQSGEREYRIDWYATRLWLFHEGTAVRESAQSYLARLQHSR
jgi:hypothetical protein